MGARMRKRMNGNKAIPLIFSFLAPKTFLEITSSRVGKGGMERTALTHES